MMRADQYKFPNSAKEFIEWLDNDGIRQLDLDGNAWIGAIDNCATLAIHSDVSKERSLYQSAALKALRYAKEIGALRFSDILWKEISVRLRYAQEFEKEDAWKRKEMQDIADMFLKNLPFEVEFAKEKSANWRNCPIKIIIMLRQVKNRLKLIQYTVDYIDQQRREAIERWLEIRSQLP